MDLEQCLQEIDDRSYLLGSILMHPANKFRIKIDSFVPFLTEMGYHIQCNYYKELTKNIFAGEMHTAKLSDVLNYYIYC
ncbi:hypothetical protein [Flavobacterium aquiphilum]|uniref:hypothetical protein n=1 Tax=Flavobacterium aquiphilum TaxID=3003261 RepID=UPI00248154B9|nr:hypothetical protein [Flavobacterium aquiphilum]